MIRGYRQLLTSGIGERQFLGVHCFPLSVAISEHIREDRLPQLPVWHHCYDNSINNPSASIDAHSHVIEALRRPELRRRMSPHITELFSLGYEPGGQHMHEIIGQNGFQRGWIVLRVEPP